MAPGKSGKNATQPRNSTPGAARIAGTDGEVRGGSGRASRIAVSDFNGLEGGSNPAAPTIPFHGFIAGSWPGTCTDRARLRPRVSPDATTPPGRSMFVQTAPPKYWALKSPVTMSRPDRNRFNAAARASRRKSIRHENPVHVAEFTPIGAGRAGTCPVQFA